jgi:hypothetical protein
MDNDYGQASEVRRCSYCANMRRNYPIDLARKPQGQAFCGGTSALGTCLWEGLVSLPRALPKMRRALALSSRPRNYIDWY